MRLRLGRGLGQLHPPGLPATSHEHLGLDDDRIAQVEPGHLLRAVDDDPLLHRQPIPGKDLLGLLLVQLHQSLSRATVSRMLATAASNAARSLGSIGASRMRSTPPAPSTAGTPT